MNKMFKREKETDVFFEFLFNSMTMLQRPKANQSHFSFYLEQINEL